MKSTRDPAAISRRNFLALMAAAPLATARAATSAPVIDTHVHVWSNDAAAFPFAHPYNPNFKPPPIAATGEILLAEMDHHGIDQAVLVQVIYYGWDNRYLADCIKRHPKRFRAQGLVDPTAADAADKLEYWVSQHGFSGMRISPHYYEGRDEWMGSGAHRELWRRADKLRAVLNFFIAAPQLAKLETLIREFPGVRVVIDHLARVNLSAPDPTRDVEQLTRLAHFPNVWVKVSELSLLSPSKKYPYTDTFAAVKRVYDAFGPDRLIWGTGFPGGARAQAGRPPLEQELALVRQEIPFLSTSDREKLLGRTAAQLWRFGRE